MPDVPRSDYRDAIPGPPEKRSTRLTLLTAIALTGTTVVLAVWSSRTYYSTAMHHYDSASYRLGAIQYYQLYEQMGWRHTAWSAMQIKDGVDIAVRAIVWPDSLRWFYGHRVVEVPLILLFFWLLLTYVQSRGGSLTLALLCGASLLCLPLVTHPIFGLADYWKCNLGVWLLASACLTWLLSGGMSERRWACLTGVLLGLLVMQRTALAVLGAVMFAPAFIGTVVRTWRSMGWRTATSNAAIMAVPACGLAGLVAASQWSMLYNYYFITGYGYGLRMDVVRFVFSAVANGGLSAAGLTLTVWCAVQLGYRYRRGLPIRDLVTAAWWCIGLPFACVLSRALYPLLLNVWTPLWIVLLAAAVPTGISRRPRWLATLALLVALGANLATHEQLRTGRRLAESNSDKKTLFDRVSELLLKQPNSVRYGIFFDECAGLMASQSIFTHGRAIDLPCFYMSVHDSYYAARFPNQTASDIAASVLADMESTPGSMAVALCNPGDIWRNQNFVMKDGGQTPLAVDYVWQMMQHFRDSPHWQAVRQLESSDYGTLLVYQYTARALSMEEKWLGAPSAQFSPIQHASVPNQSDAQLQ